jgi:hypothetical protein
MSGHDCAFYVSGRCLYEEHVNPGWDEKQGCKVLYEWEQAFDDFIDRADAFSLADEEALGIWEKSSACFPSAKSACPDFKAASAEPAACVHRLGRLCLPAMPPCEGRCSKFSHHQAAKNLHKERT